MNQIEMNEMKLNELEITVSNSEFFAYFSRYDLSASVVSKWGPDKHELMQQQQCNENTLKIKQQQLCLRSIQFLFNAGYRLKANRKL